MNINKAGSTHTVQSLKRLSGMRGI